MSIGPAELRVLLHGTPLGVLTRAPRRDRARVRVTWDESADPAGVRVSESFTVLPGRAPDVDLVSDFLGGYAPEGNQRTALAAERGIDRDDLFALLREYGGSIAGALTFVDTEDEGRAVPRYEPLRTSALGRLLRRAVEEHDQGARPDSRSTLPGFQPKVLVTAFEDGRWLQPHGGGHSTHILKPQLSSQPSRIYDEFAGHELARHMGLAMFASEIRSAGSMPYLSIERFDRIVEDGRVDLVHQEDAAQALGLDWVSDEVKFQNPALPRDPRRASVFRLAEMVAGLSDQGSLRIFLAQLVMRILLGDNDGHAKNTGVLHLDGADRLTELYDAVPNPYQEGRIDWNMAMAVDGVFDHRRISRDRIVAEARSWGVLAERAIEETVTEVIERFGAALDAVTLPAEASDGLEAGLRWNLERLGSGKEISRPRR
ncbi:type II toxin-antitoxin system HipA family toxin [Agromyces archimandritae]|uniref:HipA domain-containing protein n=1 Tax=Agromyces archimandritae TaxID=2781962 RepID=A0A975FJC7_9MICO|nr:HipA domain-containing protein [Agromyces archimandritae]QTX03588.1 HipA domain-containing protein [Agromyces archimandritae]